MRWGYARGYTHKTDARGRGGCRNTAKAGRGDAKASGELAGHVAPSGAEASGVGKAVPTVPGLSDIADIEGVEDVGDSERRGMENVDGAAGVGDADGAWVSVMSVGMPDNICAAAREKHLCFEDLVDAEKARG